MECTFEYILNPGRVWPRLTIYSCHKTESLQGSADNTGGKKNPESVGDAGSPANRSLSSSEWTPLDLAGVLAASSLNRSAASPLARSGWETPRLTAAGLLCKGGGCAGTERQVKAWLLWQSRGDVDPAGRYSDDKQEEEEEESGWAGRRVWAGLELHKLITRDANAKRSASFTRHIRQRPTSFDIRDTSICRVPLCCGWFLGWGGLNRVEWSDLTEAVG